MLVTAWFVFILFFFYLMTSLGAHQNRTVGIWIVIYFETFVLALAAGVIFGGLFR